jgi:anthranilate synthase component II
LRLLVIDNYDSFTYNLIQLIEENGVRDFEVVKNDAIRLPYVQSFDKILLSPGAGLPKKAGKMPQILQKYASTKSILGVCLGHQAIAQNFGANLYNLNEVRHGRQVALHIIDKSEVLFQNLPDYSKVGLYHSWAINAQSLPPSLKISAVADDIIMAISHIKYDVKGIQFHPESVMTEYGNQIIKNWMKP